MANSLGKIKAIFQRAFRVRSEDDDTDANKVLIEITGMPRIQTTFFDAFVDSLKGDHLRKPTEGMEWTDIRVSPKNHQEAAKFGNLVLITGDPNVCSLVVVNINA